MVNIKHRFKKDIVLVMSRQFSHKIVLESLGTKPQVEDDHAVGERAMRTGSSKLNERQLLGFCVFLKHTL